ncbi:MAG: hypothetical protein MPJ50_00675 [Pirellulales bacterium]|nr:hypothetical protein [Pirellulales bacterium]
MREMLMADRPLVLLEVLPVYKAENMDRLERQQQLQQLFADLDSRWLRIRKSPANEFAGVQRVEEIGVHDDLQLCDYIVAPGERFAEIERAFAVSEPFNHAP